ncbi:hypothetical protein ACFONN_10390 [Dyella humi]|uniref:Uncharacterized protein n=1 Tax=Dyella humi TaxID=1770547 RepID=A0ABW8IJM0_9GAMM
MNLVPITYSRVKELKSDAKHLSRKGAGGYQVLLEQSAQRAGFHHWHHVMLSLKQTEEARATPQHGKSLSAAEVAKLVDGGEFLFAGDANATGFFFREADPALRAESQASIIALAGMLGIESIDELKRIFVKAKPWAREYFKALAETSTSSRWRSETDFLFFLVLLGAQADYIAVADLIDLGWGKSLALETLQAARDFRRKFH